MAEYDQITCFSTGAAIAVLVGLPLLLIGCQQQSGTGEHIVAEENRPKQESWDVTFHITQVRAGTEESRPRMRVLAGYMANFEEEDSTYTLLQPFPDDSEEKTTAYLFTEEGDSSATITANRFLYFEDERRLRAEGDVVVVTVDNRRLETESLIWFEDDRSIRAPGFVSITTPEERVRGYNLTGDEDLSTYEIGRVTGQVTVEEDP